MKKYFIAILLLAFLIPTPSYAADKSSAFERVMKTGTIRCGYYLFAPISKKDPNTEKLSGIMVDLMNAISRNADLKIDWAEEVSFGTMYAGLQAGRYDAICSTGWPNALNAKAANFTIPIFYATINAYVRNDDDRFDSDLNKINDPSIKISTQDGSVEAQIAKIRFPKAETVSIPQMADATQLELDVIGKKADVAFLDANRAEQFLEKNPGTLKRVNKEPMQIFPFKIAVAGKEIRFRDYLNIALEEVINSGEMDQILDKHIKKQELFLRVAKPYEVTK